MSVCTMLNPALQLRLRPRRGRGIKRGTLHATDKVEDNAWAEACSRAPQAASLATLATLRPPMGVWGKMGYLVPDLNSWPSEGAQLG